MNQQSKLVILDFFAKWCGSCQTMEPVLHRLEQELGDAIEIVPIDIDENPQMARLWQIKNVPTFIVMHQGEEKWRHVGLISQKEFGKKLLSLMA